MIDKPDSEKYPASQEYRRYYRDPNLPQKDPKQQYKSHTSEAKDDSLFKVEKIIEPPKMRLDADEYLKP